MSKKKENKVKEIWATWRMSFIELAKKGEFKGCFLCENPEKNNDEANYILYRGEKNYIILNSYPYNPGHLMVAPYRHVGNLEELTEEERNEHFLMVTQGVALLKKVINPEAFNIGINLGKVAGAGIGDHVHTHIVPRWDGDTNFMPVIGDTKVLPEALAETYKKLKKAL